MANVVVDYFWEVTLSWETNRPPPMVEVVPPAMVCITVPEPEGAGCWATGADIGTGSGAERRMHSERNCLIVAWAKLITECPLMLIVVATVLSWSGVMAT